MKKFTLSAVILALVSPLSVQATSLDTVKFSIDPASPANKGSITPDDVLKAGPVVYTPGSSLGLKDNFASGEYDNLDALSYGQDGFGSPPETKLYFSVDRVAVGRQGTAVYEQAQQQEAAGDVFFTIPGSGTNSLYIDEEQLGLTAGFFGDDLDALDVNDSPAPFTYFSIDRFSASNGFGSGDLANDIFKSLGNGSYSIYASGGRVIW